MVAFACESGLVMAHALQLAPQAFREAHGLLSVWRLQEKVPSPWVTTPFVELSQETAFTCEGGLSKSAYEHKRSRDSLQELERHLVRALEIGVYFRIGKVAACSHPALSACKSEFDPRRQFI